VLLVVRNPTADKKLPVALLEAERMASIGTLVAGVAHEINNPLAYVLANLEYVTAELQEIETAVAEKNPAGGRVAEMIQALREAREGAERVRRIVRDLKTFARPAGEEIGAVDVRRVIEASINMVFNEIKHRARLIKDYGPTPLARGNEWRLGQVFLNILLNAAQAIPEGHYEENRIRIVTGTDTEGRVVVEVHDTGQGMTPEVMARVFEPLFTTKPMGVGTGLGLYICKQITEALGGTIEIESEVGVGTMVRVVLRPADPEEVTEKAYEAQVPRGRRGRLLAVDDDALVLAAVRRALGTAHEVVTESSGAKALARLEQGEHFNIILCDLIMPKVSGVDVYTQVAATHPTMVDKIVFLTGGAFTPRAREFLDTVPNPRIEKPFDPGQLLSLVTSLLG